MRARSHPHARTRTHSGRSVYLRDNSSDMRRLHPRGTPESEDQHQRNARRTTPVSRSRALVATLVLLSAVSVVLERRAQSYYSWIVPGISSTRHGTMDIPPTRRKEKASRGPKEYYYERGPVASEYRGKDTKKKGRDTPKHLNKVVNKAKAEAKSKSMHVPKGTVRIRKRTEDIVLDLLRQLELEAELNGGIAPSAAADGSSSEGAEAARKEQAQELRQAKEVNERLQSEAQQLRDSTRQREADFAQRLDEAEEKAHAAGAATARKEQAQELRQAKEDPMNVADSGGHDEFEDDPVDNEDHGNDYLYDNMEDFPMDENGEFVGFPVVDPNCKKGDHGCIKGEADNGGG